MSRAPLSRILCLVCVALGLVLAARAAAGGPQAPVVGGQPAPAGKWPDTAAILQDGFAICTGTLVAPQVVVTAGHCVDGTGISAVKLGATDSEGPGEVIGVADAIAYPNWESTYDIALLLLEQPSTIAPRAIATDCVLQASFTPGGPVYLAGFGATDEQGESFNTTLMEAQVPLVDTTCSGGDGCAPAVSPGGEFTAGGDGVDSCFGDSGGPVYLPSEFGTSLVGVVSRGVNSSPLPCGGGGIYVRPDAVIDWITETARQPVTLASCDPPDPPDDPDTGGDGGEDTGDGGEPDEDTGDGGDEPEPDASPAGPVTGGCAAGGERAGAGWALLLLGLAFALRRRISDRSAGARR